MIKYILPEEVLHLRSFVLRNGKPERECFFEGDLDKGTFHLGGILDNTIICIASFMRDDHSYGNLHGYQLRGMATHPDFSGRGHGSKLVEYAIDHLKKENIDYLWCNARLVAINFYTKLGFIIESEEFSIPGIGPHYKMKLNLK